MLLSFLFWYFERPPADCMYHNFCISDCESVLLSQYAMMLKRHLRRTETKSFLLHIKTTNSYVTQRYFLYVLIAVCLFVFVYLRRGSQLLSSVYLLKLLIIERVLLYDKKLNECTPFYYMLLKKETSAAVVYEKIVELKVMIKDLCTHVL